MTGSAFTTPSALIRFKARVIAEFGAPWTRVSVTKLGALKGVKRLGVTIERGNRV